MSYFVMPEGVLVLSSVSRDQVCYSASYNMQDHQESPGPSAKSVKVEKPWLLVYTLPTDTVQSAKDPTEGLLSAWHKSFCEGEGWYKQIATIVYDNWLLKGRSTMYRTLRSGTYSNKGFRKELTEGTPKLFLPYQFFLNFHYHIHIPPVLWCIQYFSPLNLL